ncbi:hypothetical protein [Maritimibacter sp. UBA3975]|uniref:hypothetical protein n=1 Tax=Maritimibacter sp. UBA3975 TaxID=1946833 RepID=UPI000C0A82A4|nr:hypothetical protein [Maritimibacter sp. UBA3975]MAM63862.1 hypothetical protein [Maritimibacter sp.]
MAIFEFKTPDGARFQVEAPDQRTAADAFRRMQAGEVASVPQQAEAPEEFFLNPDTGQMTSRELLTSSMEPSIAESAGIGAVRGATLGGDDELAAGVRAILPGGEGMSEEYRFELERQRARKEAAMRDHPWATVTGTIGGAVGGAVATRGALQRVGLGINAAPTIAGRMGQMAAAGATGAGTEGFLSGEGGWQDRRDDAAIGAGVGLVAAPLAGYGLAKLANAGERIGGNVLRRFFSSKAMVDETSGEISDYGRKVLRTLGYDLDEVTARMQRELTSAAEDATSGRIPQNAVENVAAFKRFDVPMTRGQARGDIPQIAMEQNFRAGTRGQGAYNAVAEFDARQAAALNAAREGIVPGSGGPVTDAADDVIAGVRRQADSARQAGSRAYDALEASGAAVRPEASTAVQRSIRMAAEAAGAPIDGGTPNAQAALNFIDNAFNANNGGAVPFMTLERARQRLLGFSRAAAQGSNGADRFAMEAVVDQFDNWMDDTISSALISGDEAVLSQAKEARSLWEQYRRTFFGRQGADNIIRKIVTDDLTPDQVASWLFGSSSHIGGGQTANVAKRVKDILGPDSPEWSNVRRAAWDRVTTAPSGEMYGPDKIVANIDRLLREKGRTLSLELFSSDELMQIREFRNMMDRLRVPSKAANPSGTSYDVQRSVQQAISRMSGIFGGIPGAAAGKALDAGGSFSNAVRARAAVKGLDLPAPASPLVAASSVSSVSSLTPEAIEAIEARQR